MSSSDDISWALVGMGAGLWMFFNGFRRLRLLRQVSGLPTSNIRSLAMGSAEVAGCARIRRPQNDPIFSRPCAYYRVQVEREEGSGKQRHWVTVHEEDSAAIPFLIEDETGSAWVLPAGAEFQHPSSSFYARNGLFSKSAPEISAYLRRFGGSLSALRLRATIIREGMPLYVLGMATTLGREDPAASAPPLRRAAEYLKADPQRRNALDTNHDGRVDAEEWEQGVAKTADALAREAPRPGAETLCLCRDGEGTLVIGESEKTLVSQLEGSVFWQVVGGPALAIGCGAYLAAKFGVWR